MSKTHRLKGSNEMKNPLVLLIHKKTSSSDDSTDLTDRFVLFVQSVFRIILTKPRICDSNRN